MDFKPSENGRGLMGAQLHDCLGSTCSLQTSSIASEPCIWFGVNNTADGQKGSRMHLTQLNVQTIVGQLQAFLKNPDRRPLTYFAQRDGEKCFVTFTTHQGAPIAVLGLMKSHLVTLNSTMLELETRAPHAMFLSKSQVEEILVPLDTFAETGTLD